jgi:predicted O-methyltransferase YrrM
MVAYRDVRTLLSRVRHEVRSMNVASLRKKLSRLVLQNVHHIEGMDAARKDPGFVTLRDLVRNAGTDNLAHFGNGYTVEGGLFLQQNPDEFAALCLLLQRQGRIRNYMEIGSASGGTCRFLFEQVGFDHVFCLDDGQHPRARWQDENLAQVRNAKRFLGDSHSVEARRFLADNVHGTLDVAFIDGDHSYEGVWADIRLAMSFSRPGTLFVLHDTVACEGVERAWLESIQRGLLTGLAEYIGDDKALGIAVGVVR